MTSESQKVEVPVTTFRHSRVKNQIKTYPADKILPSFPLSTCAMYDIREGKKIKLMGFFKEKTLIYTS